MQDDPRHRRCRRLWLTVAMACAATAGASARRQVTMPPSMMSSMSARVLLALDRLQESRWYPVTQEIQARTVADQELVRQALSSSTASIRRIAVRGIGRLDNPTDIPTLARFLGDADATVRREAANAIAMVVQERSGADVLLAYDALRSAQPFARVAETDDRKAAQDAALAAAAEDARLEALARLHYDHDTAQRVLESLDPNRPGNILLMLRRDGALRVTPFQLGTLRALAKPLRPDVFPSVDALDIVMRMGSVDPQLIGWAAQYQCTPPDPERLCGWPIRRLGVDNLAPLDAYLGPMLDVARRDPAPEVRITALRRLAGVIAETKSCAPMLDSLDDPTQFDIVRLDAIDLMDPRCAEREEISRRLEAWITDSMLKDHWSLSAHAIERLAVIDPAKASKVIGQFGSTHDLWPIRAASARAALTLRDTAVLRRLAIDDEPNVRTEAIAALSALKDPAVMTLARRALESPDDQLVATAAAALEETTDRDAALVDLWAAFKRLTEGGRDTSRIARLAILDCLKTWAPPKDNVSVVRPRVDELKALLKDFDPFVATAVAEVLGLVTGDRFVPQPVHRDADQPTEDDLRRLPVAAVIRLENGVAIYIRLLPDEAPLTVARFTRLVLAHYFDGQMLIYRLHLMTTAGGGSPGANDDSGDARFLRDEIGTERHTTGTVGLATHGRDTGDARFFIDLFGQPGFDLQYTVFARVQAMMPADPMHPKLVATNRLLEGGTILSVQLNVEPPRIRGSSPLTQDLRRIDP